MVALTSLEAGCGPRDVSLALLGRPPTAAFVPWTDAAIAGLRVTDVLDPPALARLDARLPRVLPSGPLPGPGVKPGGRDAGCVVRLRT